MKKLLLGVVASLCFAAPAGAQSTDSPVTRIRSCITETIAERGSDRLQVDDVVRKHIVVTGENLTTVCTDVVFREFREERDRAKASERQKDRELKNAKTDLARSQKALGVMLSPIQIPRTGLKTIDAVAERVEYVGGWVKYYSLTIICVLTPLAFAGLYVFVCISPAGAFLRGLVWRLHYYYTDGDKRIKGNDTDKKLPPNAELQGLKMSRWRARPKAKSRIRA